MNLKTFLILFILGILVSCASNRSVTEVEEQRCHINEAASFRY
jgi:hypothetical protein